MQLFQECAGGREIEVLAKGKIISLSQFGMDNVLVRSVYSGVRVICGRASTTSRIFRLDLRAKIGGFRLQFEKRCQGRRNWLRWLQDCRDSYNEVN